MRGNPYEAFCYCKKEDSFNGNSGIEPIQRELNLISPKRQSSQSWGSLSSISIPEETWKLEPIPIQNSLYAITEDLQLCRTLRSNLDSLNPWFTGYMDIPELERARGLINKHLALTGRMGLQSSGTDMTPVFILHHSLLLYLKSI
jgi:hypothetical protein